ncbi:hypothetical protein D1970_14665 [Mesobacillus zeae]|uniref:Uncharacterized protein n=2 Tax=Mesobacillus zeae TaxID=1917180 RepID=A0A398B8E1_9BACI|nr:hypothetical protein D1970_14665 [Mesobacillus zeae]
MMGLLAFSVVLFILSFFLKDPYGELREEIDQLSIQQVQELFQIKKKVKVLEEELLVGTDNMIGKESAYGEKREIHEIIKNQVWSLAQQGKDVEQIAAQSSLSAGEVEQIIKEFMERGQIQ